MTFPRPSRARVAALVVALALVPSAIRAQTIVAEGKHVVVRSSVQSQPLADHVREALEAAIPIYEKELPYRLKAGDRLVINLYETEAEYEAAITAAGAPGLAPNRAGTAHRTNESYLVVLPRREAAYLEAVGNLPELTHFLACHEGVHQFIYRAGAPTEESWPFWYVEGMAEHIAEACVRIGREATWPIPHVETYRHSLADWLAHDRLPTASRVLSAELDATTVSHPLYLSSHGLYDVLAADPARMSKFHAQIRSLGGAAGGTAEARRQEFGKKFAKVFADVFGPADALDAAWHERIGKLHATWFEPQRSSQFVRDELVCAGIGTSNAAVIHAAKADADPVLTFELAILDSGARQADVYLAFDAWDTRFLKIALGASGYVTLLVFDHGWKKDLQVNAKVPGDTFRAEGFAAVEIRVASGQVRVSVAGKQVFEAALPAGFDAHALWGFGACEGSVARFRKLKLGVR